MSSSQDDWITRRVDDANKNYPAEKAVVKTIKEQLEGSIRDRPLRPAELTTLADVLIKLNANAAENEVIS